MLARLDKSIYFYGLVGATAGLSAWFADQVLRSLIRGSDAFSPWIVELILPVGLATFAALAITAFERHCFGAGQRVEELGIAAVLGIGSGLIFGTLTHALLPDMASAGAIGYVALTMLLGTGVGLTVGVDLHGFKARRLLFACGGGLAGGLLGGFVIYTISDRLQADLLAGALGYAIGTGFVAMFIAMVPAFGARAWLTFAGSEHESTNQKYGHGQQQWRVTDGTLRIGSWQKLGRSDVFLPDTRTVERVHATVVREHDGFHLVRGRDNARGHLAVDGEPVDDRRRLEHGARIDLGSTALIFNLAVERKGA